MSTYVRPAEDIEAKVSGLYSKISNPVLTNLKITPTNNVSFNEIYPPHLPDLFHGNQLIVMGRFSGKGPSAIRLTGMVGMEKKEFAYDVTFPDKTNDDHAFVERCGRGARSVTCSIRFGPTARKRNWSMKSSRWQRNTALLLRIRAI